MLLLGIGGWLHDGSAAVMRDGAILSVLHVTSRGSAYKE